MTRQEAPELETRTTQLPVELRAVGARRIGGYAAVFDDPSRDLGGFVEQIGKRAFAKGEGDGWPGAVCRFNHSDEMLLGTVQSGTLKLSTDNRGLNYVVSLPECRGDVVELVGRGDVAYSSFAFQAYQDDWGYQDGTALRTLLSVRLIDVSPVVTPAYGSTSAGLRSLARFVDAPIEDVMKRADRDELRAFFVRTGSPRIEARAKPTPQASGSISGREALIEILGKRWPDDSTKAPEPRSGLRALVDTWALRWPDEPHEPKSGAVALIETLGRRWTE
jgi:uncharacterized protein